jgi:hypothetical protein
LAEATVTVAVALSDPLAAVIVALPDVLGAVNNPLPLTVPALADQVSPGRLATGLPNWSKPAAASCCVAPGATVAAAGVIAMRVSAELTVTVTLLATDSPLGSLMVAVRTYVPAAPNVTPVLAAVALPLALKVGVGAPLGTVVAAQV